MSEAYMRRPAGGNDGAGKGHQAEDLFSTLPADRDPAEEGRRLRDAGIERASLATWGPWRRAAWRWVQTRPAGFEFTSDDVVEAVGMPVVSSKNALGALIRKAATAGLIEECGYVCSRRKAARGRRILRWRRSEVGR